MYHHEGGFMEASVTQIRKVRKGGFYNMISKFHCILNIK